MAKGYLSGTVLGLFLTALSLKVYAQPVAKIDFEQLSRVIVWDVGSQRGIVDRDDDLTDLDQECTIADSSIIPNPRQIIASKKGISQDVLKQSVAQILGRFNVNAADFKTTPVAAFIGKANEPVFLLFPEQHINNPVKQNWENSTNPWRRIL